MSYLVLSCLVLSRLLAAVPCPLPQALFMSNWIFNCNRDPTKMQHSYSDASHDGEYPAASETPPLTHADAGGCDSKNGVSEEYKDFDQQYIMLDGGIFVRAAAAREDTHQRTYSSHAPASCVSVPPDSASHATHAPPRGFSLCRSTTWPLTAFLSLSLLATTRFSCRRPASTATAACFPSSMAIWT